jgi:hypothetical protein
MRRWVLAGALALAAGGQGLASDLPPPAAPPPPRAPAAYIPPPSPVYNWGGLYFGFNAGYAFGTSNWVDPDDPAAKPAISARPVLSAARRSVPIYAKAGGAWMRVAYTEDLLTSSGGITAATQVFDDNRTGFTVGAGIEIGLVENISAKIEYDFYDFGSKNYNFASITPVAVKSDLPHLHRRPQLQVQLVGRPETIAATLWRPSRGRPHKVFRA